MTDRTRPDGRTHEYSVGQRVLIVESRRYGPTNQRHEPLEAEVVKVGHVWGEARRDGWATVRFRLEDGTVDSGNYSATDWVLTPEQYALREARHERNERLRRAGVRPGPGSKLSRSEVFLDALDALVAEHLGKATDR